MLALNVKKKKKVHGVSIVYVQESKTNRLNVNKFCPLKKVKCDETIQIIVKRQAKKKEKKKSHCIDLCSSKNMTSLSMLVSTKVLNSQALRTLKSHFKTTNAQRDT